MKSFGVTAFLALAWLPLAGRDVPPPTVDEDGHFAASFPAAVTRTNQILDVGDDQVVLCRASAALDGATYTVTYCDYPEGYVAGTGAPSIFKATAKDAAGKAKGTIRTQTDLRLGDVAGSEVVIDGANKGFVERMRLFIVGDRLFQVAYRGRPDSDGGKAEMDFLDSFRLRQAPPQK